MEKNALAWFHGRSSDREPQARVPSWAPRGRRARNPFQFEVEVSGKFRSFAPAVLREDLKNWLEMIPAPYVLWLPMPSRAAANP